MYVSQMKQQNYGSEHPQPSSSVSLLSIHVRFNSAIARRPAQVSLSLSLRISLSLSSGTSAPLESSDPLHSCVLTPKLT